MGHGLFHSQGTSIWHDALTAENKHRRFSPNVEIKNLAVRKEQHPQLRPPPHPTPPSNPQLTRGHLLGVGAVPEDGVAVGHHFGTGLLAEYAHQEQHADEKDHFHLQHHYGANFGPRNSSSAGLGFCRVEAALRCCCFLGGFLVRGDASARTGDESHSRARLCRRSSRAAEGWKCARHQRWRRV